MKTFELSQEIGTARSGKTGSRRAGGNQHDAILPNHAGALTDGDSMISWKARLLPVA
jgi:hypothetical protein